MKTIYTCGPTVYAIPHIGNLRTFAHADNIRKKLEEGGNVVKHVINITDIDDKIMKEVGLENVTFDEKKHLPIIKEFTEPIIQKFKSDLVEIGVDISKINFVNVSDHLLDMKIFVEELQNNGKAYYSKEKKAIVLKNDLMDEGADFSLWKVDKNRPGWHLECTVLSRLLLGAEFDIHTGGCDLKFPHHHNENLQSIAYDNKPLAKEWVYTEHLFVDGKKMSKSLNNAYTLTDLKNMGFTGFDLRNLFEKYNYENHMDFTFEKLKSSIQKKINVNSLIVDLNKIRTELRENHLYDFSDKIRNSLVENGFYVNDKKTV